jgi:hypothetical protein
MNSGEFRAAIDALPFGKRLPGAVYLPLSRIDLAGRGQSSCSHANP